MTKRRRLIENMQFQMQLTTAAPNAAIVFDNMVAEWGNVQYPQLSVILVHLRYLAMVHQAHHWIASGDAFYGDHLMFQRIYGATSEQIDAMAEKAIGLGSSENVNLVLQVQQIQRLVQDYGMASTIPQASELAKRSLQAELHFLCVVAQAAEQLKQNGALSRGLDNMLQGLEDIHEGHVYLLKQRCNP